MRKRIVILLVLVGAAVGGFFAWREFGRPRGEQDGRVIRVSGNIEVTEVQLSFRIPGWVAERSIDEGQIVKAGDPAAKLDATELEHEVRRQEQAVAAAGAVLAELKAGSRKEDIAAGEAGVARAKAVVAELEAGSRPEEVAVAEAAVNRAKAEVAFAEVDYQRMQQTIQTGAVGQAQYDSARMAYEVAKARLVETEEKLKLTKKGPRAEQIDQAKAALREAEDRAELVRNGPRKEQIDQAAAKLQEATQALKIVKTRREYATLSCPMGGVVLSKNVEPGEFVAAGTPIVTIGNLQDIWLRAYIQGTDLGKVKIGQSVRIRTDSYPNKAYEGKVAFISAQAEFTPKSVQTEKERVKLVYRVKIDIQNSEMELKPGMPADAEIVIRE